MIVFAVFAGGFTIATFSQALLQFEFGKTFGRRRMERELVKLSGHYIIYLRRVTRWAHRGAGTARSRPERCLH